MKRLTKFYYPIQVINLIFVHAFISTCSARDFLHARIQLWFIDPKLYKSHTQRTTVLCTDMHRTFSNIFTYNKFTSVKPLFNLCFSKHTRKADSGCPVSLAFQNYQQVMLMHRVKAWRYILTLLLKLRSHAITVATSPGDCW